MEYTCADGSPVMKQTCFNCDLPLSTVCDIDRFTGLTLEQCQNVVDGNTVYVTEYHIDDLDCKKYSCLLDTMDVFQFRALRALTQPTCVSGKAHNILIINTFETTAKKEI